MTGTNPAPLPGGESPEAALAVLRNRPFLLLWLSQLATQIGTNMVLYGLTVVVLEATDLSSAVSALFLTFLVPAVLFSALAGVYVDRVDRRTMLVVTNGLRAIILVAIFAAGPNVALVLLLSTLFSTVTVFFAPAEAAMIPFLVPRGQLVSANGLFTLTLNGSFALGYALLGPLVVTIVGGPSAMLFGVAVLFALAALFCGTLPRNPPLQLAPGAAPESALASIAEAGQVVGGVIGQLREGIAYIRTNQTVGWSLAYLGIAASLIGIIAVVGPNFARQTLGLSPRDLIVVVLPLGLGIVMGVLLLNNYGRYVARRRVIEVGLVALGVLIFVLTIVTPLSRFLTGVGQEVPGVDLSWLTSLVSIVVAIAFLAGVAYGIVAISAQTQLQEDIPGDVRGRVFGVLNMLISVASILPIIVVGTITDLIGTTAMILLVAVAVAAAGVWSRLARGPLRPDEEPDVIRAIVPGQPLDPAGLTIDRVSPHYADEPPEEQARHTEPPGS
ncbi:MAG: MFS transporter [Chloroflexi bacterium]|nr:MFS transporter [Chloroflexota bacterium]